MREIKYRQRIDGQFHYWGLIGGVWIDPASSSTGENPQNTVHDQFTGHKDRDGVEIYEGDIFKGFHDFGPAGLLERVGRVSFNKLSGYQWNYWIVKSLLVIGNIHENPELLEKS